MPGRGRAAGDRGRRGARSVGEGAGGSRAGCPGLGRCRRPRGGDAGRRSSAGSCDGPSPRADRRAARHEGRGRPHGAPTWRRSSRLNRVACRGSPKVPRCASCSPAPTTPPWRISWRCETDFWRRRGCVLSSRGELPSSDPVRGVDGRVAGIVLAAGAGERFGGPKQIARWKGIPLLGHALKAAREGGLSPIVVVLGARQEDVRSAAGKASTSSTTPNGRTARALRSVPGCRPWKGRSRRPSSCWPICPASTGQRSAGWWRRIAFRSRRSSHPWGVDAAAIRYFSIGRYSRACMPCVEIRGDDRCSSGGRGRWSRPTLTSLRRSIGRTISPSWSRIHDRPERSRHDRVSGCRRFGSGGGSIAENGVGQTYPSLAGWDGRRGRGGGPARRRRGADPGRRRRRSRGDRAGPGRQRSGIRREPALRRRGDAGLDPGRTAGAGRRAASGAADPGGPAGHPAGDSSGFDRGVARLRGCLVRPGVPSAGAAIRCCCRAAPGRR